MLILYPETLPKCVRVLRVCWWTPQDSLCTELYYLQIRNFEFPFISFSSNCPNQGFKNVDSKNGKSAHLCIIPNLSRNALTFSPYNVILAGSFPYVIFLMFLLSQISSNFLLCMGVDFIKRLFYIYGGDNVISVFGSIYIIYKTFIDMHILNHPQISRIKPT